MNKNTAVIPIPSNKHICFCMEGIDFAADSDKWTWVSPYMDTQATGVLVPTSQKGFGGMIYISWNMPMVWFGFTLFWVL